MRLWTIDERQAALRDYDILDTPPEVVFEDLVELARTLTGAPVALISFVEAERQWFKARRGTDLDGTGIENSMCAIAVMGDMDALVIPDTTADPRTAEMGIVTGPPAVRAYAGVLLRASEGTPLGTLCVLDVRRRAFSGAEVEGLVTLARQASGQLELRRLLRERTEAARVLRDANLGRELAMQAARLGRWDHHPAEGRRFYDARAREILGLDDDISAEAVLGRIHPEDRPRIGAAIDRVQSPERSGPYDEQYRVVDRMTGAERWVSGVGASLFENGVCTRFIGVLEDVTEQRRSEELRALLAGELNHRVKNILALAQSVVDATLRGADDLGAARGAVGPRLRTLAQAHELLLLDAWRSAPMPEIVAGVMRDLSLDPMRFAAHGPPVRLASGPALQITLALHELATNATKHGALSGERGRVEVGWSVEDDAGGGRFHLSWEEEGGPPVTTPVRRGFGARVIGRAVEAAFQGEVRADYAPEGLRWTLTAPAAALRDTPDAGG